jgi:hypothetical protein
MGLLSTQSGSLDVQHAQLIADCVAEDWNSVQKDLYGIMLWINPHGIKKCCQIGTQLFENGFFPPQPGPFKRVAAFVVLGRLYPFFKMTGREAPQTEHERQAWLARFMGLLVPAALRTMKVFINNKWTTLEGWKGFPSPHYKLEFLAWLRWLDHFERYRPKFPDLAEWTRFSSERLARMVMSTALMLEACYYIDVADQLSGIRAQVSGCLANLNESQEIDLIYDYIADCGPSGCAEQ